MMENLNNILKSKSIIFNDLFSYLVQSLSYIQPFLSPCSMAHLPVHHQLPELTQTHVH